MKFTKEELPELFKNFNFSKKVVVCFDEARGLFGSEFQLDESHSLVFRAVRRASTMIKDLLGHDPDALVVFIFTDTNSNIRNFVRPLGQEPLSDREKVEGCEY